MLSPFQISFPFALPHSHREAGLSSVSQGRNGAAKKETLMDFPCYICSQKFKP